MSLKRKRNAYDAGFKLRVVEAAEATNNCSAARQFFVSEKNVRDWRKLKETLMDMPKSKKANHGDVPRAPKVEKDLAKWIEEERLKGIPVSRLSIRIRAQKMAKEPHYPATPTFSASAGWCDRFMARHQLSLCMRTKIAQKLPASLDEKVLNFQIFLMKERGIPTI